MSLFSWNVLFRASQTTEPMLDIGATGENLKSVENTRTRQTFFFLKLEIPNLQTTITHTHRYHQCLKKKLRIENQKHIGAERDIHALSMNRIGNENVRPITKWDNFWNSKNKAQSQLRWHGVQLQVGHSKLHYSDANEIKWNSYANTIQFVIRIYSINSSNNNNTNNTSRIWHDLVCDTSSNR